MRSMGNSKSSRRSPRRDPEEQELFDQFEIGLTMAALEANSSNVRALQMLGQALSRMGRHEDALEIDLRLAGLRPRDPFVHYNLACSYSNVSDLDGAFDALGRAFDLGYRDYPHLLKDPDLEKVRMDDRFKQLLDRKWGKRQP